MFTHPLMHLHESPADVAREAPVARAALPGTIDPKIERQVGLIYSRLEDQIVQLRAQVTTLRSNLDEEMRHRSRTLNALQTLHARLLHCAETPTADLGAATEQEIIAAVTELAKESEQIKGMLKTSVAWFRALTEHSLDLTAILDPSFNITYLTPSASRILGTQADTLLGMPLSEVVHPEDRSQVRHWLSNLVSGLPVDAPFILRLGTQRADYRILEVTGNNCIDLPAVGGIVINGRDVTERAQAQAHIRHLAHHDELTALPNRNLIRDRAKAAMVRADRDRTRVAIVFLDLDRFKHVNDSLGHQMGDLLLRHVADRLCRCVRQVDSVGRLGGDEFVLVLTDFTNVQDVSMLAQKLLREIAISVSIEGHELHPSASLGISLYPDDGNSLEALMRNADTAMYHAKAAGRNAYRFFTDEMNHAAQARLRLETRLRNALRENEFVLHYQPIICAKDGTLVSVEALIRWQDPTAGLIMPGEFIAVAEDLGLIEPIGAWVLQQACRQMRAWRDAGLMIPSVAVNLSVEQFRTHGLFDVVMQALSDSALEPGALELEITESLLMEHAHSTIAMLNHLNALGVQLSIDDFGTGYSSLSYLTRLPIHKLKIDRTFLRDLGHNRSNAALASAIIAMGHSLELKVLAEGVETLDQLHFVKARHCDQVQGYLFARPLPAADLARWALDWRRDSGHYFSAYEPRQPLGNSSD